jgi:hypothetical protein
MASPFKREFSIMRVSKAANSTDFPIRIKTVPFFQRPLNLGRHTQHISASMIRAQ